MKTYNERREVARRLRDLEVCEYDSRPILAAFALFFVIACWLLLS